MDIKNLRKKLSVIAVRPVDVGWFVGSQVVWLGVGVWRNDPRWVAASCVVLFAGGVLALVDAYQEYAAEQKRLDDAAQLQTNSVVENLALAVALLFAVGSFGSASAKSRSFGRGRRRGSRAKTSRTRS
jgi:hypothetical protein